MNPNRVGGVSLRSWAEYERLFRYLEEKVEDNQLANDEFNQILALFGRVVWAAGEGNEQNDPSRERVFRHGIDAMQKRLKALKPHLASEYEERRRQELG
jgi:hypothetical protein